MRRNRRCKAVKAYIDTNIGAKITLVQMASEASMSTYHFARKFKAHTGKTPCQFVMRRRIKTARVQLSEGTSIAVVAAACGFSSQAHLTRAFKRHTGQTPGQYMKKLTNQGLPATDRRTPDHHQAGHQW